MAPPTIAYVGASTNNASLLKLAYEQCGLYREVNLFSSNSSTPSPLNTSPTNGLWHHIVGPQSGDPGLWATGNGWAAGGMTRVLATIMKAPAAHDAPWRASALADLSGWIKEIIDGARAAPLDNGLLRNYLDDTSPTHGYGEISGSTMLASVAYRMVILDPEAFPAATYVAWADSIRAVISGTDALGSPHVTSTGIVTPAVDPLWWQSPTPWTAGRCVFFLPPPLFLLSLLTSVLLPVAPKATTLLCSCTPRGATASLPACVRPRNQNPIIM
jgi:hypothetical protein